MYQSSFRMNKYLLSLISLLLCALPVFSQPTPERPKLGLVLSGGGAKGLAHIGIIRAMEKAGLTPDYVTGASMGSIVGGLYAMGYSGDSIESFTKNVNWDKLLSNEIPLVDVGIEEKSEFKRYLFDFNLVKGKPKFGESLIKDQNLREFLAKITVPGININDFIGQKSGWIELGKGKHWIGFQKSKPLNILSQLIKVILLFHKLWNQCF